MTLSELKAETLANVKSLGNDQHFVNRITSIGMSEGVDFEVSSWNLPRKELLPLSKVRWQSCFLFHS